MARILVDTSFLISFADPERANHDVAVQWFRHCVSNNVELILSALVASEFEVRQPITDLPLQNFSILPFNLDHAIVAAKFKKLLFEGTLDRDETDSRSVVLNDLCIIGQAHGEGIEFIITEDRNTLSKYCSRLKKLKELGIEVILLTEGFERGRLSDPAQREFPMDES